MVEASNIVLEDVLGIEDRFVKSLGLAPVGSRTPFGFYAVLGSKTIRFGTSFSIVP